MQQVEKSVFNSLMFDDIQSCSVFHIVLCFSKFIVFIEDKASPKMYYPMLKHLMHHICSKDIHTLCFEISPKYYKKNITTDVAIIEV